MQTIQITLQDSQLEQTVLRLTEFAGIHYHCTELLHSRNRRTNDIKCAKTRPVATYNRTNR